MSPAADSFTLPEATIEDIHAAYAAGRLTARQLVQMYIDRIEAYDRGGPRINSIITVNPAALEEADRLDAPSRPRARRVRSTASRCSSRTRRT